jgi:hypothetical protein
MNIPRQKKIILVFAAAIFFTSAARSQNLDQIGVTLLQTVTTNLNGTGVRIAQAEADTDSNTNDPSAFEVNPATVNQPGSRFTYISAAGTSATFPNSVGNESGHADAVGGNYYGISGGVATNIVHLDNFDGDYFYNSVIAATLPQNINDRVVNQSFIFSDSTVSDQQTVDSAYDNYAAQFNTLFASGAGNGAASGNNGFVNPPATSYNGIGVGVSDGSSSVGPTIDNGRAKPDIIAPGGATSFSTPYVAGSAAVLMQAGLRGDGGGDTNSAADIRTIKSVLLNGAIKPDDWTNIAPSPLDYRYGAGVLNVFNSYKQLAGGKHGYIVSTTVSSGGAHPPTGAAGTVGVLSGWDFNTNTSSSIPSAQDGVKHYYFNVTNNLGGANFTATATLVWNRQRNQTAINNLNLFLYNAANSNLVAASTSAVDNVEHLFIPKLPQGRYDLQVWMGAGGINPINNSEPYALAWEFFSQSLAITNAEPNVVLSWPVYPDGFVVESTTNLVSLAVWSANNIPSPMVTNNQNYIPLNATNAGQFFRLRRP